MVPDQIPPVIFGPSGRYSIIAAVTQQLRDHPVSGHMTPMMCKTQMGPQEIKSSYGSKQSADSKLHVVDTA